MKKILSILLTAVMLASSFAVVSAAEDAVDTPAENLICIDSDFSGDGTADKDFYIGAYKTGMGLLVGYTDPVYNGYTTDGTTYVISYTHFDPGECTITVESVNDSYIITSHVKVSADN